MKKKATGKVVYPFSGCPPGKTLQTRYYFPFGPFFPIKMIAEFSKILSMLKKGNTSPLADDFHDGGSLVINRVLE